MDLEESAFALSHLTAICGFFEENQIASLATDCS